MGRKKKSATQTSPRTPEGTLETNVALKITNLGPNHSGFHTSSSVMDPVLEPQNVMISSPLVHPSAGMISVGLHNTILAYKQVLGLCVPPSRQIEPL